jgi:anti-repressor protein
MALLTTGGAPLTMTTREMASLTGKEHKHVLRDAEAMLAALSLDVAGYAQNWTHPQNSQTYRELALPKDLTLTLVSGYSVEMRHRIVQRWLALERAVAPAALDLRDIRQLAPLTLQLVQVVHEQQAELEAARPKVEFHDAVAAADGGQPVNEVAKVLGLGERRLREFLRQQHIFMQHSPLPTQEYVDRGHFIVIERTFDNGEIKKNYAKALVTGSGLQFLQRKLAAAGITQGA